MGTCIFCLALNWDMLTCLLGIDGQKTGGLSTIGSQISLSPTLPLTTNHKVGGACFPALLGSLFRLSGDYDFNLVICPTGL